MFYALNQEKYNLLSGLAYRIADNAYMIERFGIKGSEIERAENHKTIIELFNTLDKMRVPYWVQNAALSFGDDWRRYKTEYLSNWLNDRCIDCTFVSVR